MKATMAVLRVQCRRKENLSSWFLRFCSWAVLTLLTKLTPQLPALTDGAASSSLHSEELCSRILYAKRSKCFLGVSVSSNKRTKMGAYSTPSVTGSHYLFLSLWLLCKANSLRQQSDTPVLMVNTLRASQEPTGRPSNSFIVPVANILVLAFRGDVLQKIPTLLETR